MISCLIVGAEGSGHHGLAALMRDFLDSDTCIRDKTGLRAGLWNSKNDDSNQSREKNARKLARRLETLPSQNLTHLIVADSLPAGRDRELPNWPDIDHQRGVLDHLGFETRVLLLQRDPLDCLGSICRRLPEWDVEVDFRNELLIACHTIVMMAHTFQQLRTDYRFLSLNDLVTDPGRAADKVAEYFAIPRDKLCPGLIKAKQSGRSTLTAAQVGLAKEYFATRQKMLSITFPAEKNLLR